MFILLGILGVLGIVLEEIVMMALINTGLSDIYMIVVPMGSIVLAGLLGTMIAKGAQYGKVKNKILVALISVLIGATVFPAILYSEYRLTYISEDGEVNMSFDGDPLSSLMYYGEKFEFQDYVDLRLETDSMTIGRSSKIELDANENFNKIMMLVKFLCFVLVTPISAVIDLSKAKYCTDCRRYYSRKKLFKVNTDEVNQETFAEDINDQSKLQGWMASRVSKKKPYYLMNLYACKKCGTGFIMSDYYVSGKKTAAHADRVQVNCPVEHTAELVDEIKRAKLSI